MPPVGFKPTTTAGERPQTYTLNLADNGTGLQSYTMQYSLTFYRLLTVKVYQFLNVRHSVETDLRITMKDENSARVFNEHFISSVGHSIHLRGVLHSANSSLVLLSVFETVRPPFASLYR
jgi:hypothetical protein